MEESDTEIPIVQAIRKRERGLVPNVKAVRKRFRSGCPIVKAVRVRKKPFSKAKSSPSTGQPIDDKKKQECKAIPKYERGIRVKQYGARIDRIEVGVDLGFTHWRQLRYNALIISELNQGYSSFFLTR